MPALLLATLLLAQTPTTSKSFDAPKYGLALQLPADWTIAAREDEDRIFVAIVPQKDFERPGVAACELGAAPQSLDEYRTRIDRNARANPRASGKLAVNRLLDGPHGPSLETIWEFHPDAGGFWREVSIRLVKNRQLYRFVLNVEDCVYAQTRPLFDAMIAAARFTPPNTGADLLNKAANRWIQREYRFALDLPTGWRPVLAPSSVALLYATGEPHGIWSDNLLVLAHKRRDLNLQILARDLPDQIKREEPGCEILSCKLIPRGQTQVLETIVRTNRGPFSMTVIEHRFHGDRFDYEVKYTVESKRFNSLLPSLRKSLQGFQELPGPAARAQGKSA